MNVFTKDPRSPEVVEALKKSGQVVVEVTTKQLYILHQGGEMSVEQTMRDWFVRWRGRSHAYRDGSHVGGADEVVAIRNITEGTDVDISPKPGLYCVGSKDPVVFWCPTEEFMDDMTCRSMEDVVAVAPLHNGKPLKVSVLLCAVCREKLRQAGKL